MCFMSKFSELVKYITNPYALTAVGAMLYFSAVGSIIHEKLNAITDNAFALILLLIAPLVFIVVIVRNINKSKAAVVNPTTPVANDPPKPPANEPPAANPAANIAISSNINSPHGNISGRDININSRNNDKGP